MTGRYTWNGHEHVTDVDAGEADKNIHQCFKRDLTILGYVRAIRCPVNKSIRELAVE